MTIMVQMRFKKKNSSIAVVILLKKYVYFLNIFNENMSQTNNLLWDSHDNGFSPLRSPNFKYFRNYVFSYLFYFEVLWIQISFFKKKKQYKLLHTTMSDLQINKNLTKGMVYQVFLVIARRREIIKGIW